MRFAIVVVLTVLTASVQQPRTLVFQALDAKTGAPVLGIQPQDLEVAESGAVYPLSSLRFGASPMDIVLVLATGKNSSDVARIVAHGARLACSEFERGDRLAFITFGSGVKVRFRFTENDSEIGYRIEQAVQNSTWSRGVKVYDAIQAAVDLFPAAPDPSRTRAVLVITNSLDEGSHSSLAAIGSAAKSRNVALFVVSTPFAGIFRESRPEPSPERVVERLRPVAEATGGEARRSEVSGYILRQSFEPMRSRYVATYRPAPGAGEARRSD